MKQAVHSHEQTIAEKDSIITSLQKQVSDSRQELKKQIQLMDQEKAHTKDVCHPYVLQLS